MSALFLEFRLIGSHVIDNYETMTENGRMVVGFLYSYTAEGVLVPAPTDEVLDLMTDVVRFDLSAKMSEPLGTVRMVLKFESTKRFEMHKGFRVKLSPLRGILTS